MYIFICIYIYIYMYLCIYVSMYICIYVYIYIRIYLYMYMCIGIYIHIYTSIHIYIYIYIHTHIHSCVQIAWLSHFRDVDPAIEDLCIELSSKWSEPQIVLRVRGCGCSGSGCPNTAQNGQ